MRATLEFNQSTKLEMWATLEPLLWLCCHTVIQWISDIVELIVPSRLSVFVFPWEFIQKYNTWRFKLLQCRIVFSPIVLIWEAQRQIAYAMMTQPPSLFDPFRAQFGSIRKRARNKPFDETSRRGQQLFVLNKYKQTVHPSHSNSFQKTK